MNEVYLLVGKIIESIQYIELKLLEGIKYHKLLSLYEKYKQVNPILIEKVEEDIERLSKEANSMTFGMYITTLKKTDFLVLDDLDYLESLLSKRNQLVHQFFKMNVDYSNYLEYLKTFLNESLSFYDYLCDIVDNKKDELSNYYIV